MTGSGTLGSDPLVDISYRQQRPSGVLSFGLSQRVNTDNNNNEEITTSLRASYDHQINNVSSFGLSGSFFNRNELQQGGNDGQRIDLSLTYRHDLTRDWGLVGGYTHSLSAEDNRRDRRSNTIFVGLQRSFAWSP